MAVLAMKRLGLISVSLLLLLTLAAPVGHVSGYTPPTEFRGTSPPIGPGQVFSVGVGSGWSGNGDVIQWNWNATGNTTFHAVYTRASDLQTVSISGLQMVDGILANVTGWYGLTWFNNEAHNVTVSYDIETFTPVLETTSPKEGSYLNSRSILVRGVTEGFATGVLVGTDPLHLQKASLHGGNWTEALTLAEGPNTVFIQSYYWIRPLGERNFTITRMLNVTVDTVPPTASIVSPVNGTSIRGREVQVYWNCSDAVGLERVDLKVDNGSWTTVSWGNMLGLGYTTLGLPTGEHTIEVRGVDRAGNGAIASVTVRTNSNDWSLGGPMYGLPVIGIIGAALIIVLVAYWSYRRPPQEAQAPKAEPEKSADQVELERP